MQNASTYNSVAGLMPVVNMNQPSTTLQIRLLNSQACKLVLNETHTVNDLYVYVDSVVGSGQRYKLMTGYPPREVSDRS